MITTPPKWDYECYVKGVLHPRALRFRVGGSDEQLGKFKQLLRCEFHTIKSLITEN